MGAVQSGLGFFLTLETAFKFVRKGVDTPFSRSLEIVPELSGASFLFKLW